MTRHEFEFQLLIEGGKFKRKTEIVLKFLQKYNLQLLISDNSIYTQNYFQGY